MRSIARSDASTSSRAESSPDAHERRLIDGWELEDVTLDRHGRPTLPTRLLIEPCGLEVEIALHALHHVVVDHAVVAERQQRGVLGREELAHDALVGGGALLDVPIVSVVEPRQEAVAPESERAP